MKKTKQPINTKTAIIAIVAVIVLAAVLRFTGLASFGSYTKVMFFENKGSNSWNAHYLLLSGNISRTINLGEEDCDLNIAVETKSGTIHLKIIGADGTSYFDREDISTSTYTVTAKGSVAITAITDGHNGSFSVERLE